MLSDNLIKGQLIELKVQEEMIRYGFDVSIPAYNASKYDLLVDTGTELLKIQVKKAIGQSRAVNSFSISCTTQNVRASNKSKHKYTSNEIDYFATVWKDKVYLIPVDETSITKTIREDEVEYLAETIFYNYQRLSDEELYNYSSHEKHYCENCGCEIQSTSTYCISCCNLKRRTVERPTREELKNMIRTLPFTTIAKQYFVSDNAIRKWCDAEHLPRKSSDIKRYSDEEWRTI